MLLSFSKWALYNRCPAWWHYEVTIGSKQPPGPAAARGLEIHNSIENYINKHSGPMPTGLLHEAVKPDYADVFEEFRMHENGDVYAEKKVSITLDGKRRVSEKDGFLGYLDAVRLCNDNTLHIGEWKSGKPKDDHRYQRELYALFGLVTWRPTQVTVTTHYVEATAPSAALTVKESAIDKLLARWQLRYEMVQEDTKWAPAPGFYCAWCPFSARNGGPCKFGR